MACLQTNSIVGFARLPQGDSAMFFRRKPNLNDIAIAAPCPTSWEEMEGDDKIRYCSLCSLNVYNLSGMTRREGEALMKSATGPMCITLYRRRDGTLITKDCPVGRRLRDAFKRRMKAIAVSLAAVFHANSASAGEQVNEETKAGSENNGATIESRPRFRTGFAFYPNVWRRNAEVSHNEAHPVGESRTTARWGGIIPNVWHKEEIPRPTGYSIPAPNSDTQKALERFKTAFGKPLKAIPAPLVNASSQSSTSKKADTSALDAFNDAQRAESTGFTSRASVRYQFAIHQFIRNREAHDPAFQKQVATAYAKFLKKQHQPEEAEAILDEFCKNR